MIQHYHDAMRAAAEAGRADWAEMQRWIERFVCGTHKLQNVVGKRDHPDGGFVTQEHFDRGEKSAHVCPFVRDAIVGKYLYIEESPLAEILPIRKHLIARIDDFKKLEPAHDPLAAGHPAVMPTALKVLLVWFPNYHSPGAGP